MATDSTILAWRIPGTEEPGGLPSVGSHRVGHNWSDLACMHACMHWRRKWQPTPVFSPGESQGRRSLVGCRLWGRTESDTTDAVWQQQHYLKYGFLWITLIFLLFFGNYDNANFNNFFFLFKLMIEPKTSPYSSGPNFCQLSWVGGSELKSHGKSLLWM